MKPALMQILFLSDMLQKDKTLQKYYYMENVFDKLMNIKSYRLYKYILYLLINNKRVKLNKILKQLGFKARKL